jgi:hypothetical protein
MLQYPGNGIFLRPGIETTTERNKADMGRTPHSIIVNEQNRAID